MIKASQLDESGKISNLQCTFLTLPMMQNSEPNNENKAGYTANTSCGRVGRGGNARFHTFQLVLTDGPTDQRTNGPTDKGSYRVACPQLKRQKEICDRRRMDSWTDR